MKTLNDPPEGLGIAAVERDTGLPKDTLRVWERRYGFPRPLRDANGERVYPAGQVDKLRLIRRLLDQGLRPSRIVAATTEELAQMLAAAPEAVVATAPADCGTLLGLMQRQEGAALQRALQQNLLKNGLQRFLTDTLVPLTDAVGQAWLKGELSVAGEHLYTEQVHNVLRGAIANHGGHGGSPSILLTTFPNELHSLGLLMAEAMVAPEGAQCTSLGTQTPLADIERAATQGGIDVVALSFSSAYPARQAVEGLNTLRARLPARVALWAGGHAVREQQRKLPGIRVIADLPDAIAAIAEWRAGHPA
ncbi:MerR family transcriptional regulator [Aromatoleum petrolei]|uniref:MerR family transcriptional regulator n=1 Tax=Aromatoleum petrolei TaxID=76116 RepID=A0ABX1MMQ8_9RHOO|nr:MerR family transcriptional regulator [Aromatoleum petrolei]NMF87419.1 MerR family transcriptional regulator [Aromatoleum petrolei]QTQ35785.1 Transcriptional regulator, MerR family [Aromatoleum petrolei]